MTNNEQLKNLIYKWIWAIWEGNDLNQFSQFYHSGAQGFANGQTFNVQKLEENFRLYHEKGSVTQVKILDLIFEKDAFALHAQLKSKVQDKTDENPLVFIGYIENDKINKFWFKTEKTI